LPGKPVCDWYIPDDRDANMNKLTKNEELVVAAISGFSKGKHYFQLPSLLPTLVPTLERLEKQIKLDVHHLPQKEALQKLHVALFGKRSNIPSSCVENNLPNEKEIFTVLSSITRGGRSIFEFIKYTSCLSDCYCHKDRIINLPEKTERLESIFKKAKEIHIRKLIWLLEVGPQLVRNGHIPADIFWKITSYIFSCSKETSIQIFAKENKIFSNKYDDDTYTKRWIMSFSLQNMAFILQNMNHVSGGLLELSAVTTCHLIRMLDFGIEALSEKQVNAPLQGMVCKVYQYGTLFWNKPGQLEKTFQNRYALNRNLLPVNNPDLGFKK
jgi:hypothetical protein